MIQHKSIPTATPVEFINVEPQSPLISHGVAKVLYLGANRNGSYFTKEVVNNMIPSLYGIPVVGKYEVSKGDYLGHEKQTQIGMDGRMRTVSLTIPLGYVPENGKVWYQTFLDDDEVEREYLCCDVKLWTGRYPESSRVLHRGNHQSMELDPDTMMGEWAIADNEGDEYFMVSEAYFSALCVLGEDVEPCFEGAGIAHEFSLSEEDKNFLYELDKAIDKVKGDNNMKVENYMSVEDVKLMLQAGSGEPEVSQVQDGFPTDAVTPADNIATPAEGLATDANFEENEEEQQPPVSKEQGSEAGKELEQAQTEPSSETSEQKSEAGAELEQVQQEEKKDEMPPTDNVDKKEEQPVEGTEVQEGIEEVPNAMNPTVTEGLDPVSKIDQIMLEDKDVLETELLKKILELLEGRMGGVASQPAVIPPVENVQQPPVQEEQPPMPVEQPAVQPQGQVEEIRRQYELEIDNAKKEYEALKAEHEELMGEFNKLKEYKLQIEMNEKEQVIGEYSMLPESVLCELKQQAKTISKADLEAQCALAFVKNSKREQKDNSMLSYSYSQVPQNDFLLDLDDALAKTIK